MYNGKKHKIKGIRFTSSGVMYQISFVRHWVYENELSEYKR